MYGAFELLEVKTQTIIMLSLSVPLMMFLESSQKITICILLCFLIKYNGHL